MTCYVDASVVLRIVLDSPGRFTDWPSVDIPISSELLRVECRRGLYRGRSRNDLDDVGLVAALETMEGMHQRFEFAALERSVLRRASEPFPTPLRTLDAIHLATALLYAERPLDAFLTHDVELGRAARAMGLRVLGC